VDFLDVEQMATPVETAKKAGTLKGVPAKLEDMSASEQAKVKQAVEQAKQATAEIDLNRLATTVDGYASKPNYIVKSALDMELIWCPPGGFVMGVGIDSEKHPQRKVVLTKGFYLGKFEVTQEQYEKVVGNNPSKFKNKLFPVEQVSWRNANMFCSILNRREKKKTNWTFSLPTEAEFEYASRAGLSLRQSIQKSNDPKFGNCRQSNLGKTTKVGNYPANNYGFFDLFGNVWEMCSDRLSSYTSSTAINPKGPNRANGQLVLRGGSFCNWGAHGQSSWKASTSEEYKHACIGFRVAFKQAD